MQINIEIKVNAAEADVVVVFVVVVVFSFLLNICVFVCKGMNEPAAPFPAQPSPSLPGTYLHSPFEMSSKIESQFHRFISLFIQILILPYIYSLSLRFWNNGVKRFAPERTSSNFSSFTRQAIPPQFWQITAAIFHPGTLAQVRGSGCPPPFSSYLNLTAATSAKGSNLSNSRGELSRISNPRRHAAIASRFKRCCKFSEPRLRFRGCGKCS